MKIGLWKYFSSEGDLRHVVVVGDEKMQVYCLLDRCANRNKLEFLEWIGETGEYDNANANARVIVDGVMDPAEMRK